MVNRLKNRVFVNLVVLVLLLLPLSAASAQANYSFTLPEEVVHAYWENDGTLTLSYTFVFDNDPDAHPIDYVDVGMPTYWFYEKYARAAVNGISVPVSEAEYAGDGYGLAIVLGNHAILPGEKGTVTLRISNIAEVLYQDSEDENYASAVFSPTWFGEEYVHGNTALTVVYHLPQGVQPDEPRYHLPSRNWPGEDVPQIGIDEANRITYTWSSALANGYTQYFFGASFPATYVPETAIQIPTWWERLGISSDTFWGIVVTTGSLTFIFALIGISFWQNERRRLQYVPPKIGIEGHGIKRGLTAVEAAILMGEPLDKVLTMILFSVIKKGVATVRQRDPLRLDIVDPLPENLRSYEKDFLKAMLETDEKERRVLLRRMITRQIAILQEKMRGFSRKETIRYYRSIAERAWKHVEMADTPEVKAEKFGEYAEWTLLDKDFEEQARRSFGEDQPIYTPTWWPRFDPSISRTGRSLSVGGGGQAAPSPRGTRVTLPGATFAESLVSSVNQVANDTVGNIKSFTSEVTQVSNPVPVSSSGGSSRSGGGCACACACAGCACACAGGGR